MKKALLIMNGLYVNQAVISSATTIAKSSSAHLHAFFLTRDTTSPEGDYFFPNDLALTQNTVTGESITAENLRLLKDNIGLFEDSCMQNEVPFYIATQERVTVKELITQSAFADYIIADPQSGLYEYGLTQLLAGTHCPALLTSSRIEEIHKVVFTYDGSFSAMLAMKMFSYVFPEWVSMDTFLLHMYPGKEKILPHEQMITGWLSRHYPAARIELVPERDGTLIDYLDAGSENTIVVMGAYGRSTLSRVFHNSLADEVVEKTKAAVFMIHE